MGKLVRSVGVVWTCVRLQTRTYGSLRSPALSKQCRNPTHGIQDARARSYCCTTTETYEQMIQKHTKLSRDHMTPEITLHLITKECPLWSGRGDNSPFVDPFWAFYWPGGQVLTRYILDNPGQFRGQTVLDIGAGCGASAIAASIVGASHVIANDIDLVSIEAIKLNAKENNVTVETDSSNLIGQLCETWTTILIGDMFYEEAFRDVLVDWLTKVSRTYKTHVFIGDPGRLPLVNHPVKSKLTKCAAYDLPEVCREENSGMTTGFVWKLVI